MKSKRTANHRSLPLVSRTLGAHKQLLRFIYGHGLATGDRLPPQQELRKTLNFSNDTLTAAMEHLVNAGVLVRKRRVGTVVANPDAPGQGIWSVALAFWPYSDRSVPFDSQLFHVLQSALVREGIRCRLYAYAGSEHSGALRLGDFPALAEDVTDGYCDAVVTPAWLDVASHATVRQAGVPLIHVGSWEDAGGGVIIDQQEMAEKAVALLASQECRRLAVVSHDQPKPGYERYWHGFCQGLTATGLTPLRAAHVTSDLTFGVAGGAVVADKLLALPPARRPDGLVVLDDWLTLGLCARLSQGDEYRPRIVTQSNRQAPLAFALPVTRFEVDIAALGREALALVHRSLRNPQAEAQVVWVPPAQPADNMEVQTTVLKVAV